MIDEIIARLFGRVPSGNLLRETKALAGAIPLIAQALVEGSGKKIRLVRSENRGGKTDGSVIAIEDTPVPVSNEDTEAFVRFTAIQLGLIHHEIGHVNYTDFTAARSTDAFIRYLENIIEDVRQEMLHIACVRNGRAVLDSLGMSMHEHPAPGVIEDPAFPLDRVFTSWLLCTLRCTVRGEGYLASLASRSRTVLLQRIGPRAVDAIQTLLPRASALANTSEAIALAADIADVLKQQQQQAQERAQKQAQAAAKAQAKAKAQARRQATAQEQPQEAEPQDAPDQQDDDAGDGTVDAASQQGQGAADTSDQQGDGAAGDSQDPSSSPDQDGESVPGASNDGDQGAQDAGQQQAGGGGQSQGPDPQQAQAIESMLEGEALQGTGDRSEQARQHIAQLSEEIQDNGAEVSAFDPGIATAQERPLNKTYIRRAIEPDLDAAMGQVQRVRSALNKRLQAQSVAKTARSARGSRLSTRALVQVPMGDPRLFRKYHPAELLDTAVVLAMDCSGSMRTDERIVLADQAAYATACALETLPGCHVSVIAFPGNQMVLRFGQRARKHRGGFAQETRGCTPMHEAVQLASMLLAERTEPRKLLLVVTDGEADSNAVTKMALLAAERMGIETMAIGIGTDEPRRLFDRTAVIHDMSQLAGAMLSMLGSRMLSERNAA